MTRLPVDRAAATLAGVGIGLALVAAAWHLVLEPREVAGSSGPLLAFLIDGLPPLALVYAGYRLDRSDLDAARRWTVVRWSVAGAVVFVAAIWLTVFVRRLEGRVLAEPVFELIVAADAGALSGALAGYYSVRARHDAERARQTRHALGFVNRLLRHDLRNDLNVVRGRADLLADYGGDDAERVRENASVIVGQADRMDDLVERAGAIAETLLGEASGERVDLTAVVGSAVAAVDTRDATVVTDLPDRAPVAANGALRSVVENLVENAVEHGATTADAADLRVEVSVAVEGEVVRLRVADDGVGVPDDTTGSVFEPRAGTTHGGGLHLVARLVEGFGGAIRVAESGTSGAAFEVDLPRATGE